jgi:HKD family nuclease
MNVSLLTQIAPENQLLNRLGPEADAAERAFVAVSFVQRAGMRHLFGSLKGMLDAGKPVAVYTSGYLGITDPAALADLLRLAGNYDSLRVFFNPADRFHSKFFFFAPPKNAYTLFLGSSNVSVGGFTDTGELNVHIRGKSGDRVHRDIRIVMANLEKNAGFRPLTEEAVAAYRATRGSTPVKTTAPKRRSPGAVVCAEQMPVQIITASFTNAECERVAERHPRWAEYVSYDAPLRRLKSGDHFLCITKRRGERVVFTVCRYAEHDRVPGVGTVARVTDGDELPLSRLAKNLRLSEKELVKVRRLDVCGIAILRRDFPQAFG